MDPTALMATPARCVELQQALALLKGASDAEVEHVGGAYGVLRPLKQLRAALPACWLQTLGSFGSRVLPQPVRAV